MYTLKDINTCFPWISAQTLRDRVRAGLVPTSQTPEDSGKNYIFSFEQVMHAGIVDELVTLGCWRGLKTYALTEMFFDPFPDPEDNKLFERSVSKADHERAVQYYDISKGLFLIHANFRHTPLAADNHKKHRRLKRSERFIELIFMPRPKDPRDAAIPTAQSTEDRQERCFSTVVIDGLNVLVHCERHLKGPLKIDWESAMASAEES